MRAAILWALGAGAVNTARCCRFADKYQSRSFDDVETQKAFITEAVYMERGFFAKPFVGYDGETGWTYDGIVLDDNGRVPDPVTAPRVYTAASKEALHLSLLALSIPDIRPREEGIPYPYTEAETLALLELKASAYEDFHARNPVFGGWLPWLCVRGVMHGKCADLSNSNGSAVPDPSYRHADDTHGTQVSSNYTLPGLDNGEYAWAMYTVARAAKAKAAVNGGLEWRTLAQRYEALLAQLQKTAVAIWVHNGVCDTAYYNPATSTYDCTGTDRLTDPFEGELMVLFVDLLGTWGAEKANVTAAIWAQKQNNVEKTELYGLTVQKGWHFSAHEQWKMLQLPYLDLPKTREVLTNGEVARTHYSLISGIPGLVGAANEPFPDHSNRSAMPGCQRGYCRDVGIPPLAQAPVMVNWTVAPYAAFPLTLVDKAAGLSWYSAMLSAPRMQTQVGGGESISTDGQMVSNALTWDTKGTMLLAMYGGLGPLIRPFMDQDGIFLPFQQRVEGMYLMKFGPVAKPQQVAGRSHMTIPDSHQGYPSCTYSLIRAFNAVALPLVGLYLATVGGHFMVVTRMCVGALAGALPGARLNFIHFAMFCDYDPRVDNLRMCAAVDDPVAAAVLLGFFGAMIANKSLMFTVILLAGLNAMLALTFVALALPREPRSQLFSQSGLLITFGASMVLGAVCLCSCYRKASRLLTGTLTAMLGGALLVLAVWDIEEVDILDPVWTGSDDGLMSPLLLWAGFTALSLAFQFRPAKRAEDHGPPALAGEWHCEAVRDVRFHKSDSLPDVRQVAQPMGMPLLPRTSEGSGGAGSAFPRVPTAALLRSNSFSGMSDNDSTRSVPDLRKLEEDARREELQGRVLDRWIQEGASYDAAPERMEGASQASPRGEGEVPSREGLLAPHKEPLVAKVYLWSSVLLTLFCTACTPFTIDWLETNVLLGLIFCAITWFLLWNVTDLFISTIAYHVFRLIWGFKEVPRKDFLAGLPNHARTCVQFCLLSDNTQTSQDTWENAYKCYMQNLDPNGNMAVSVVSVSNKLSIVEAELECANSLQERFLAEMNAELEAFLNHARAAPWPPKQQEQCDASDAARLSDNLVTRWYFWTGLAQRVHRENQASFQQARTCMQTELGAMAKNIFYFHRNCRVLKKPGQYQDLIILSATGDNKAYTYTDPAYGKYGRKPDTSCFGFSGNLVNDSGADMTKAVKKLQKRGEVHVKRMERAGQLQPYRYSMVMDSDTASEWRSILRLVEYAVANPDHGLFQCALSLDDQAEGQTWYMWAEGLRNASVVNLPIAHFAIFQRHGFYGKGLFDNEMMINSVIGRRPEPEADGSYKALEALPVDIMSHDTFEAKILRPCFIPAVRLREEPAKNAISAFPQTTRWLTGEVRNATYAPGGFKAVMAFLQRVYGFFQGAIPQQPFIRQFDIPVAWSTDYISHISFRAWHAGPAIMTIILLRNYCVHVPGLLAFRNPMLSFPLTVFTIFSLFILPRGLLVLDMVPSVGIAKRRQLAENAGKPDLRFYPSKDVPRERPPRQLSRCGVLCSKLLLSLAEAALSALIFGPECLVGLHRAYLSYSSQITGKVAWRPQAAVDKEVEEHTTGSWGKRFRYVMKEVWHIPLLGAIIAATTAVQGIMDPFSVVLWVSWLLHPFVVTWGCSPCPGPEDSMWVRLVRHVSREEEVQGQR